MVATKKAARKPAPTRGKATAGKHAGRKPHKPTKAPVAPPQPDETYAFEAMGFVDSRKQMDLLDAQPAPNFTKLYAQARTQLQELGIACIEDVTLSEDDGQEDEDIKVFVVVRLQGRAGLEKTLRGMPVGLRQVLDKLAESVCCAPTGDDLVGAENWELTES